MKMCFVVLDHRRDESSEDLVASLRVACPPADVFWYDSGGLGDAEYLPGVPRIPVSRPMRWGKLTPFFFDLLQWAATTEYDYVVNVETDMLFMRRGFDDFVRYAMRGFDYMAPHFRRASPGTLHWGPYRSLAPELSSLRSILGMTYTNRAFSPGQVFSARYAERVVTSRIYGDILDFVQENQGPNRSRSLQEVLLPTLADRFDLEARDYPAEARTFNRWRPYWTPAEIEDISRAEQTYFVHPVRRAGDDPARQALSELLSRRQPAGRADGPLPTGVAV